MALAMAAQACCPPAPSVSDDKDGGFGSAATGFGTGCAAVSILPSPSWPWSLAPQQTTLLPSEPQTKSSPATNVVTCSLPATHSGTYDCASCAGSTPSTPPTFLPQQRTPSSLPRPALRMAQVKPLPAAAVCRP